jgi:hypothetical protein
MNCQILYSIAQPYVKKTSSHGMAVDCVDNSKSRVAHTIYSPTTAAVACRRRHKIDERSWTSRCHYLLREPCCFGAIIFWGNHASSVRLSFELTRIAQRTRQDK